MKKYIKLYEEILGSRIFEGHFNYYDRVYFRRELKIYYWNRTIYRYLMYYEYGLIKCDLDNYNLQDRRFKDSLLYQRIWNNEVICL